MVRRIPHKIKLSSKDSYDVVIVPRFDNSDDLGRCDPNIKQIKLCIEKQSESQIVSTLTHEILHLINFSNDLGITENQILGLEKGIISAFKLNHTFAVLFFKTFVKRMSKK